MIQLIKDTSLYAIGEILTRGISFLSLIIYSHFVSVTDMGVFGYIMVVANFITVFLGLGLDNAYMRYFFEYKEEHKRKILTTTLFAFLFFWTSFVLIGPIIYAKELSYLLLNTYKFTSTFLLSLLSSGFKLFSVMLNQALRNNFKIKEFVIFNLLSSSISLGTTILLFLFSELGITSIFIGMIIGDIVIIPFRLYAVKNFFTISVDFSILKNLLSFGIPFVPTAFIYWVLTNTDRIMLKYMSGMESVGIYTVAMSLSSIMYIISNSVSQAWSPHAVKSYEEDKERAKILFVKFLKLLIFIVLFIVFCASMLGKEVISIIFRPEYKNSFYPFLFLLVGVGFQITTQVTAIGISLAKKTIYFLYITMFVSIVNIVLNFILVPIYKEIGASFATMTSFGLLTFIYSIVSQKFFRLDYDLKFIFISLLFLVFILAASYLNLSMRVSIFVCSLIILYFRKEKILGVIR